MKQILCFITLFLFFSLLAKNKFNGHKIYGGGENPKSGFIGNLYILTIGIDNYGDFNITENAERDAKDLNNKLYNNFDDKFNVRKIENIKNDSVWFDLNEKGNNEEHKVTFKDGKKLYYINGIESFYREVITFNLLAENATKKNIYEKLGEISKEANPEDLFVFYYGSMSQQDEKENTNLYFHGSFQKGKKEINQNEVAPLSELAIVFNKIAANRQLFIFEAGDGNYLAPNLLINLFDNNPIYEDTERNRCIITTRGVGQDKSQCDSRHGPLVSYLLGTDNILDVFENRSAFYSQVYANKSFCREDNQDYVAYYREDDYRLFTRLSEKRKKKIKMRGGDVVSSPEKEQSKTGQTYAIVVGTNEYSSELGSLNNPVNDADAVTDILESKYNVNVTKLLNPAIEELRDSIYSTHLKLTEKDQFIFFIAGHGYYNSVTKSGHLAFKESQPVTVDKHRKNSYILMSELQNELDQLNAKNVLVVLDVCFGASFDLQGEKISLSDYKNVSIDVSVEELVNRNKEKKSRIFIASGEGLVPDEYWGGSRHSPFAEKLIRVLQNESEFVSAGKIFNQMLGNITEPVMRGFRSHEEDSDFLLAVDERNFSTVR